MAEDELSHSGFLGHQMLYASIYKCICQYGKFNEENSMRILVTQLVRREDDMMLMAFLATRCLMPALMHSIWKLAQARCPSLVKWGLGW